MSRCRSCGAPIRWVKTEKGKSMPIDPAPADDGNIELRGDVAVYTRGPTPDEQLRYKSHFATCPNAREHRKP